MTRFETRLFHRRLAGSRGIGYRGCGDGADGAVAGGTAVDGVLAGGAVLGRGCVAFPFCRGPKRSVLPGPELKGSEMPFVRPVGDNRPPVVFTTWFVRELFGNAFVLVAILFVEGKVPKEAVFVLPPVIVTPAPPVPPRAVPVVTTVG